MSNEQIILVLLSGFAFLGIITIAVWKQKVDEV